MYGRNRLKSFTNEVSNLPAEEAVDRILENVHQFSEMDQYKDDIAILLVEIL